MTTINEMLKRFQRLNLRKQVPIIIEQNKETLIALNQRQLYVEGKDSRGYYLRGYAYEEYADFKHYLNPQPGLGNPDLYKTGAFFKDFVVRVNSKSYFITSKNKKTKSLTIGRYGYGEDIFGLSEESKTEFVNETLFIGIKRYTEQITGLRFV